MMAEAITGSVEIVRNDERTGVVGTEWVPGEVPIVLRNLYGIRDMEPQEPEERPTGRTPEYQWSGLNAENQSVTVLLWRDIPFEETYAAEIGPGLVESEE